MPSRRYQDPLAIVITMALLPTALLPPLFLQCRFRRRATPERREAIPTRFAHYLEDFTDDEGFLQATHQAGLQVEKKKALKQAREQMRAGATSSATRAEERKKEEKRTDRSKQKEEARNIRVDQAPTGRWSPWGQLG